MDDRIALNKIKKLYFRQQEIQLSTNRISSETKRSLIEFDEVKKNS